MFSKKIFPIVYAYIDSVERFSFVPELCTDGMKRFLDSRKGDIRTNSVSEADDLRKGDIFYITCIDEEEKLKPLYDKYRDRFHCVFQKDIYTNDQWLEIMPIAASKSNAIRELKALLECEKVISFGDALNDIPMFEISDECYAVENAVDGLKAVATGIIGSNREDSVAKWLLENYR